MKRHDDYSIDIPATEIAENSPQTEETSLQMEELEPRVAPSAAWGS
jgi:hypothetical protein